MTIMGTIVRALKRFFSFRDGAGKGERDSRKRHELDTDNIGCCRDDGAQCLLVEESASGLSKVDSEIVDIEVVEDCGNLSDVDSANLADGAILLGGSVEVDLAVNESIEESAKLFEEADGFAASEGELSSVPFDSGVAGAIPDDLPGSGECPEIPIGETPLLSEVASDVSGEQSFPDEADQGFAVDEFIPDSSEKGVDTGTDTTLSTGEIELASLLDARSAAMLVNGYGLSVKKLSRLLGVDCELLEDALDRGIGAAEWLCSDMSESDKTLIDTLIRGGLFSWETKKSAACLFNNEKGEAYAMIVDGNGIRLFGLKDMPAEMRRRLIAAGMDRLTCREVEQASSLGEFVKVLGVKHFKPVKVGEFRDLASHRGMSYEEYSEFLFGVPYCSHQTAITDSVIEDFLTERTSRDGVTVVPAGYEGQWLRAFAKAHGMTVEQLLRFYGFKSADVPSGGGLRLPREEPDMAEASRSEYGPETLNEAVSRAFRENALIGNAYLSEAFREELNRKAQEYIGNGLKYNNLILKEKMVITLAASYLVKDWDKAEAGTDFWQFVAVQFGFRGQKGSRDKIRNLLYNCIECSLKENGRWFIDSETGRMFQSTLLVHGMGPRSNWLILCDFLYDFYVGNLGGQLAQNDPLVAHMVGVLAGKLDAFRGSKDFRIENSKIYQFQDAIKKIVCFRPQFAAVMFERMLRRMDALISKSAAPAQSYEERLVDVWWASKASAIDAALRPRGSEVASERTSYRVRYLIRDGIPFVVLPVCRLEQSETRRAEAVFSVAGTEVKRERLRVFGDEFGKSIAGVEIPLSSFREPLRAQRFEIRVRVLCDDEIIYDSKETLFRKALILTTGKEVKPESCAVGDYYLVVPRNAQIDSMNVEIVPVNEDIAYAVYVVTLEKGFFLAVNDWVVLSDEESASSGRPVIQVSKSLAGVRFVDDAVVRTVVSRDERLVIVFQEGVDSSSFEAIINDGIVPWESFDLRISGGNSFYSYPLDRLSGRNVNVLVKNRLLAKNVGVKHLRVLSDLSYRFNRKYYFSRGDYSESSIVYDIDGVRGKAAFSFEDRFVSVVNDDGAYEVAIPRITVKDVSGVLWGADYLEWAGNVSADRFLMVSHPDSCVLWLRVDGKNIPEDADGRFSIGSAVRAAWDGCRKEWFDVMLGILDREGSDPREYRIGRIAARETFTENPILSIQGKALVWNLGGSFVGDAETALSLVIRRAGLDVAEFAISSSSEMVASEVDFEDGVYEFEIVKASDNPFIVSKEVLSRGTFFVGDKEAYRFVGSRIVIDATTFEGDVEGEGTKRIELRETFIENVVYRGTELFEGVERAVYSGMMYYIDSNGSKRYYPDSPHSFTQKRGLTEVVRRFVALNPVKIICLSDMVLCLTDSEGDVPYCERRASNVVHSITALDNPEKRPNDPDSIIVPDLFSYRKEAI